MSWFPEIEEESWSDAEQEIAPGVIVERRRFLTGTAGAFAFAALGSRPVSAQERPDEKPASPSGPLDYGDACAMLQKMGARLVATESPNEDAYLYEVASVLLRTRGIPDPKFRGKRKVAFAGGYRKSPISIVQIRLEAGARLPWHDHENYSGVLFGMDGSIRCKNYEVEGATQRPPKGEDFTIKETSDLLLTKGRASSLSRTRDNVHDLTAGESGGRVLDVFTFFPGKRGGSAYMNVDPDPVDAKNRRYRARWR